MSGRQPGFIRSARSPLAPSRRITRSMPSCWSIGGICHSAPPWKVRCPRSVGSTPSGCSGRSVGRCKTQALAQKPSRRCSFSGSRTKKSAHAAAGRTGKRKPSGNLPCARKNGGKSTRATTAGTPGRKASRGISLSAGMFLGFSPAGNPVILVTSKERGGSRHA